MGVYVQAFVAHGRRNPLLWPVAISFGAHLLVLGFTIFDYQGHSKPDFMPSVIDVRMVDLPERTASTTPVGKAPEVKVPKAEQANPAKTESAATAPAEAAKPEVSVAPRRKKTKTALKYKTFKNEAMKEKALKQLKQKLENSTPRPLQDKFKELREKVAKEGKPVQKQEPAKEGTQAATGGGYSPGSKQEIELIDLYSLEIAYAINKNWAFAEQLSSRGKGNKLMASIAFKVMPDGTITDIFFTDRSGNPYLDDSAYKAVVKSSPVKPYPPELKRTFIEMGLHFTPEGVR